MCGIAAIVGEDVSADLARRMNLRHEHRGPDARGVYRDDQGECVLGHTRLAVIDLTSRGEQPMSDQSGRFHIVFNGEIYNFVELQAELDGDGAFSSTSDTEVLLHAYIRWGPECLSRLQGMFAFVIWDQEKRILFAARDRFGVKPLYWGYLPSGALVIASEIKALFAAGLPEISNPERWATYLAQGVYEHGEDTFWSGVRRLEAGCSLQCRIGEAPSISRWYDLIKRVTDAGEDRRDDQTVIEHALTLIDESLRFRFRSDVPVGVCVSGGLDSSLLVRALLKQPGAGEGVRCFTFACGDAAYDELPWVRQTLADTGLVSVVCPLKSEEVPALAAQVSDIQDEPFGGVPTLGMAKVHQAARESGVVVLLDGNGLDEGWAGYDYYRSAENKPAAVGQVQGAKSRSTRPDCLVPEFLRQAKPVAVPSPFADSVLNLQARDLLITKIPRAMRFADRVSMMESREVREPFLDHRLVELGFRQPTRRRVQGETGKWLMRQVARQLLSRGVREAPKRPVQTPQREWLRGPLKPWVGEMLDAVLGSVGGRWMRKDAVQAAWKEYLRGESDNSFWIWQWVNLGLIIEKKPQCF